MSETTQKGTPTRPKIDFSRRRRPHEQIIQAFLFLCAAISIFVTVGIVFELAQDSLLFFRDPQVSFW
ncbi:MAG: hypothetical protein MI724_19880 [Spirochaetales bacterium]|nr:hypothetical protein [Spirochaetales bacterium]